MKNTVTSHFNLPQSIGLIMMGAAAIVGMIELPDHPRTKILLSNQPAFAFAVQPTSSNG